jgi:hypothetical protein
LPSVFFAKAAESRLLQELDNTRRIKFIVAQFMIGDLVCCRGISSWQILSEVIEVQIIL